METDHTGPLLELSRDILSLAVSFSGRKSVDRFGMTSRFCHSLVNDDDLWYNLLMREWKGISMSLHDWGAISSWRGVWNALNRYGEHEGVHQCLEAAPYGILCAVYFKDGALLCDALLPQGCGRLFNADFDKDGEIKKVTMLPGFESDRKRHLQREASILINYGFSLIIDKWCPSQHQIICSFGGKGEKEEEEEINAIDESTPQSLLVGIFETCLRRDARTVKSLSLARLIFQPKWTRGGMTQRLEAEIESHDLHGSLWFGNYGEHYGPYR